MTRDDFFRFARFLGEPALLLLSDGQILAANPAASALLGLAPDEPGDPRLDEFAADPPGEVARYLGQCSRTRERVLGNVTLRTADGARAYRAEGGLVEPHSDAAPATIFLRLVPREAATNRFALLNQQIAALNRQVRERLRSEEALRAERERLRVTLESIGDAVIATDADGRITFVNPVAAELTGWAAEEAVGHPLEEVFRIVNESTHEAVESPVARVVREGAVVGLANHTVLVARDGAERTIEDSGAPIHAADGRLAGVVLVFRDVSERNAVERERERILERERRAREMAEEASRAKDEFLAMISHELRTPLNSMLGWLRLMRSGRVSEDIVERGMGTIERNVRSQAQLIEDLLDVSRIVTGQLRLSVATVDLSTVVTAAADSVRPAADAKSIRLELILDPDVGHVLGDAERLQQVVWNLLTNAIKFTPKGGDVRLHLARAGSQVEILVRDSGQGIDPEFLPFVFDRFRQADASITRRLGGLGLGLAIVKHIVEAHGGTVTVESAGLGLGACFAVRLPIAPLRRRLEEAPASAALESATGLPCPPALEGVRILVVDDERDTRDVLALTLETCKAEVRQAGSTAEALEVLAAWRPDVLISDIGMPGEDGYALISKVRALGQDGGGAVPAVALTAFARYEDRMKALGAGFQMHVTKPIEPSELIMVVSSLLGLAGRR